METLGAGIYLSTRTAPVAAPIPAASQVDTAPAPSPKEPRVESPQEFVVKPGGESRFTTLTEALKEAPPGTRITVHPGRYHERLVLEKPVEIVGLGRRQEVVFEAGAGSTVVLKTSRATIRGVTIEQSGEAGEVEASAIDVADGQLVLDDCAIRSQGKDCVRAQGDTASLIIRHCAIRDGASSGIRFGGGAHGVVEDCDFEGDGEAAIVTSQNAIPLFRQCRINGKNKKFGLHVADRGRVVFEDCVIASCSEFGVLIEGNSTAALRDCTIRDNKIGLEVFHAEAQLERCSVVDNHEFGLAFAKSEATVSDCTVRGNKQATLIVDESNPHFRNTKFQNSTDAGINVAKGGGGFFDHCDISENAKGGAWAHRGGSPRFQDCDFRRNSLFHAAVQDDSIATFVRTKMHDGDGLGVSSDDSAQMVLFGCEVYANKNFAVLAAASSRCTIQGGSIRESPNSALRAAGGSSMYVAGCSFVTNPNGDAFIMDRATLKLERCTFKGGRANSIYVKEEGSCEADTCTFEGYAKSAVWLEAGSMAMRSCTVSGSQEAGVVVAAKAKALLRMCTIAKTARSGVVVLAGGALDALECRFNECGEAGVAAADGALVAIADSTASGNARAPGHSTPGPAYPACETPLQNDRGWSSCFYPGGGARREDPAHDYRCSSHTAPAPATSQAHARVAAAREARRTVVPQALAGD